MTGASLCEQTLCLGSFRRAIHSRSCCLYAIYSSTGLEPCIRPSSWVCPGISRPLLSGQRLLPAPMALSCPALGIGMACSSFGPPPWTSRAFAGLSLVNLTFSPTSGAPSKRSKSARLPYREGCEHTIVSWRAARNVQKTGDGKPVEHCYCSKVWKTLDRPDLSGRGV